EAFVDAPTITPENPTSTTAVTLHARMGGCHTLVESENAPEVILNGNQIDLIVDGISHLPEGHPLCIWGIGVANIPVGTFSAGHYTLRLKIRDVGFPELPIEVGSVSF